ncbi:MAG: cytochrome C oxidase subunit II [Gemmatimonadales bacterium]
MNVDLYERIWMWGVGAMLAVFFGSTAAAAVMSQIHPPSHIETIDPRTALSDPRFKRQGVSVDASGRVHATIVGMMFVWLPAELVLPADTPVTFHLTSPDVIHGLEIVRTNGQAMVVPGYVSQFTTQFAAGEYLVACNEYCGVGHHTMASRLKVVPKSQWQAPTRETANVQ